MTGLIAALRSRGAFQSDGNSLERAADVIERLSETLEELARSADTAELLLQRDCPGEAASLRQRVAAAKDLLTVLQCKTCRGHGWIDDRYGGHSCADCSPALTSHENQTQGEIR